MNELIFNSVNQNPMDIVNLNKPNAVSVSEKNKAELKKVAEEFEAVFIGQLLKIMRETIEESGLEGGGFGKTIYTELFDQEIALSMAKRGALGIGDIIYRSMTDNEAVIDPESFAAASSPGSGSFRPTPEKSNDLPLADATEARNEISIPILPVNAPVSSAFGMRSDPFTGKPQFHKGMDLAAPAGTPVVAALPGKVTSVGYEPGYGNNVVVEHGDGLRTRYGHLASINVKVGDMVTSDDTLGKVGSTGRSTGAHLHFEVTRMGRPIDPAEASAFQKPAM